MPHSETEIIFALYSLLFIILVQFIEIYSNFILMKIILNWNFCGNIYQKRGYYMAVCKLIFKIECKQEYGFWNGILMCPGIENRIENRRVPGIFCIFCIFLLVFLDHMVWLIVDQKGTKLYYDWDCPKWSL